MSVNLRYSYVRRRTFMHSLDPVSKLVWVIAVSILAVTTQTVSLQALLLLSVLFVSFVLARIPIAEFWRNTRYFLIISAAYFVIQLVFVPGQHVFGHLGPVKLTWEALDTGITTALRIYIVILASLIFVNTTAPRDFALVLYQKLRINYVIAYMLFLGLRYLPLVEATLQNIREAQMVRGVGERPGIRGLFENFKRYSIPLLATTLQRGRITAWAMDSKCFRAYPQRTSTDIVEIPARGIVFASFWGTVLVSILGLQLFGWRPPALWQLFGR